MSEMCLSDRCWLGWDHCGSDGPQQLRSDTWAPLPPIHIKPTTQKSIHYENRLKKHTSNSHKRTKWVIMCWKGAFFWSLVFVEIKEMHTKWLQFLHLYSLILQIFFKLLLIIYCYHLQYLNIGFFFFIRQLKTCLRFLPVCTVMRIYNNKYRSRVFFYLPILLKVFISVYRIYIHIRCWCRPPPTHVLVSLRLTKQNKTKNGFSPPTHRLGSWGSC